MICTIKSDYKIILKISTQYDKYLVKYILLSVCKYNWHIK